MKKLILALALCAWLGSLPVQAQKYSPLFFFTQISNGVSSVGSVVTDGATLYGTEFSGTSNGDGSIFSLSTDGTGYTNLVTFTGNSGPAPGKRPSGRMILSNGTLYGTTQDGGIYADGTVFSVSTNGQNFFTMHNFDKTNGLIPQSGLALSGGILYGTTTSGANGAGTTFSINTDGTGFRILHNFGKETEVDSGQTNLDGSNPEGDLVVANNVLYGTTSSAGPTFFGTVWSYDLGTSQFTVLHAFPTLMDGVSNIDGADSVAGLAVSGNTLYGVTSKGGVNGNGTVFSIGTDGNNFNVVYAFSAGEYITGDGSSPRSTPIVVGDTLYGETAQYGPYDGGTVFKLDLPSGVLSVVHAFVGSPSDGSEPLGLTWWNGILYGTTYAGGGNNLGEVFGIAPPEPSAVVFKAQGRDLVFSWTNAAFNLELATNVIGPYLAISNTSPYTNSGTAPAQFLRLKY